MAKTTIQDAIDKKEKELLQGKKFDGDKPRVDLVDPVLMLSAANAMAFGAEKYGENNWRAGIKQSRIYGALLRHLFAYWQGENNDHESGYSHLDHAAAMLMMLAKYHKDIKYMRFDDRAYYTEHYVPVDYNSPLVHDPSCRCYICEPSEDLTPSDSER